MNDIIKQSQTIESLIDTIVDEVFNGNVDPLEAFVQFKRLNKATIAANTKILSQAITEAEKHGGSKPFELHGKTLQVVNVGGRWDFKDIPVIQDAEKRLKGLQEVAKNAQKTGVEVADTETGEIIGAATPPLSTETIKITETKTQK